MFDNKFETLIVLTCTIIVTLTNMKRSDRKIEKAVEKHINELNKEENEEA